MDRFARRSALRLATLVSLLATMAGVEVEAGPWIQMAPDGSLAVGMRLDTVMPSVAGVFLTASDGEEQEWSAPRQMALGGRWGSAALLSWKVPADAQGQSLRINLQGRSWELAWPRLPAREAEASLILVGAAAYPDRAAIEVVQRQATAPVQAVLFLSGPAAALSFGRGGWEHELAILVVGEDAVPGHVAAEGVWSGARAWGRLGLDVVGNDSGSQLELARDLSPHRLPILHRDGWDLLRSAAPDPAFATLIQLANRQHLPLALVAGGGGGGLSDPLRWRGDRAIAGPGGLRLAMLDIAGLDPVQHPPELARVATGPALGVLSTAGDALRLTMYDNGAILADAIWPTWPQEDVQLGGGAWRWQLWRQRSDEAATAGKALVWLPPERFADYGIADLVVDAELSPTQRVDRLGWPADGLDPAGSVGWGLIDAGAALQAFRAAPPGTAEAAAAADHLAWAVAEDLRGLMMQELSVNNLLDAVAAHPHLLHRFLAIHPTAGVPWLAEQDAADPLAQRAGLAGWLERGFGDDDLRLSTVVSNLRDPISLRLIASLAITDSRRWQLAAHLRQRWERQAAGQLPLDEDPLLQLRLAAAVFASPYLRPDPLRELARSLQDQVHPSVKQLLKEHPGPGNPNQSHGR